MAEHKANSPMPSGGAAVSETERELFSDDKKKFMEDLDCLYIKNNQSGRLMFADKWPLVAKRIFDPKLTHYDHEGAATEEEREERAMLEDKAVEKREEFLNIFSGLDTKLVVYGSLQMKELEKLMEKIDRPLAELIFSERFVDKFFPKAPTAPGAASSPSSQSADKPAEPSAASRPVGSNPEASAQSAAPEAAEKPEDRPQKENVVVPDIETESIGHVDHSYNTRTPVYDAQKGENGEDEGDDGASWLDMPEDEFDDIMPISTESNTPKAEEGEKKAPSMGLRAHQGTRGDEPSDSAPASDDAPQSSDTPEQASQPAPQAPQAPQPEAPSAPPAPPPPESAAPQAPSAPQAPQPPQAPSNPPPPSGMGLRAHQQTHGGGQEPAEPPQQSQTPPPQAPQAPQSPPPPQGMGMGGRPQPENPPSAPQAPPAQPSSGAPPLPGSDNAGANNPEANAPRKPSLDDIDKHLGRDKPPPLPGSDDDKSRY